MWIVMEANEDAELIVGFIQKIDKEDYFNNIKNSSLTSVLNTEKVKKENVNYIPASRVHAIGAGVLLSEIQQTSNVTNRVYD